MLAEHGLRTTTGQADQAAERLGILRRAQQRHLGWLEAHDAELRVQERAVAREDAWRRRVDQRAVALDPPGWLLAELGPVPTDPQERTAWRAAAAELDGYRRAYGLDHPGPAKHGWGRVARDGRAAVPATPPRRERAGGAARAAGAPRPRRRACSAAATRRAAADGGGRASATGSTRAGCWAPNHAGDAPGRRRDWQAARAALERLAGWTTTATTTTATARRSARPAAWPRHSAARNATAASWQKGAAHAPAPRPRRLPGTRTWTTEELGRPVYQGDGLSVRELTAEELQRFLDAHAGQPAQLLGSGWAALDPPGHPRRGSPDPSGPDPRRCRPGRSPAATAAPAAPPWSSTGGGARIELAGWTRSLAWRAPLVVAAGVAGQRARRPGRPAVGRAGRPGRRRAGRLAAAVPPLRAGPHLAARRRRRAPHRPAAGPARPRRLSWSSTTWPCPARPPTWITW